MLITTGSISPRTKVALDKAGLDLRSAARLSDLDLLKIKGIGQQTLIEIRNATPYVYYMDVLTPDLVRGYILVIDIGKFPSIDSTHLLALLSASRGFALAKDSNIGLIRRISGAA
jgi:hypothetical protein